MPGEPGWKAEPDPAKTLLSKAAGNVRAAVAVPFKAWGRAKRPGCRRIEAVRVVSTHRRQSAAVAAVAIVLLWAVVEAVVVVAGVLALPGAAVAVAVVVEAVVVEAAGSVTGRFYDRGFVNDNPGAKATLIHPGLTEV